MYEALRTSRDVDLRQFSSVLYQQRIFHRITEEGEEQVLWVGSEEDAAQVRVLFKTDWHTVLPLPRQSPSTAYSINPWKIIRGYPLTLLIMLVTAGLFPVTSGLDSGDINRLFQQMTFVDFQLRGQGLYFADLAHTIDSGQYWRLLTPMFLHFGWLHIVFNLLWVWEVGRRIELINGAPLLLLVTLASSLSANFMQYFLSGPSLFGGMSGVVFGYLGYSLVWSRLAPQRTTGLANGLYIFMLIYLVAGFTGAIDLLGMGSLANGAHLGGLLGGVLVGVVAGGFQRLSGPT